LKVNVYNPCPQEPVLGVARASQFRGFKSDLQKIPGKPCKGYRKDDNISRCVVARHFLGILISPRKPSSRQTSDFQLAPTAPTTANAVSVKDEERLSPLNTLVWSRGSVAPAQTGF
jgi:hypothetical protein